MTEFRTMESPEYLLKRVQKVDYTLSFKIKRAVHYAACYLSISGLGFFFACLILGASDLAFGLAVFQVVIALVAVVSDVKETRVDL